MIRVEPLGSRTSDPARSGDCIVLPPAMAAPSYLQAIAETMPASINVFGVCSPGRGALADLPPHADVQALVHTVGAFIASRARPTVLLGHSLGALHALAVAADDALRSDGTVVALVVAAAEPPGRPVRHTTPEGLIGIAGLEELDAPGMVGDHLRALAASDLAVARTLRRLLSKARVDHPIEVFLGADDPHVDAEKAHGWARHARSCRITTLPGGHDFVIARSNAAAISASVLTYLLTVRTPA